MYMYLLTRRALSESCSFWFSHRVLCDEWSPRQWEFYLHYPLTTARMKPLVFHVCDIHFPLIRGVLHRRLCITYTPSPPTCIQGYKTSFQQISFSQQDQYVFMVWSVSARPLAEVKYPSPCTGDCPWQLPINHVVFAPDVTGTGIGFRASENVGMTYGWYRTTPLRSGRGGTVCPPWDLVNCAARPRRNPILTSRLLITARDDGEPPATSQWISP